MDIPGLSMAMSQMQVQQQASVSVAKMAMDGPEEQMKSLIEGMTEGWHGTAREMERSVTPELGGQLDVRL